MEKAGVKDLKNKAAVLVAINDHSGREEVLLTLRAEHLNNHSGEVAFPGGKWEPGDSDLCATALRESYEEVGLKNDNIEIIGSLPTSYTRQGTSVTPYIGKTKGEVSLSPNPDELSALFWFPMRMLTEDIRVRTDIFKVMGREYWAPVYEFQEYVVWGFTARVLVQLVNNLYGVGIGRKSSAPEVQYPPTVR